MGNFLKKVIDWAIEKEESLANNCAVPMDELEKQIKKVQEQKQKVQNEYEKAIDELDDVLKRLEKIKNTEILRCNKK